MKNKLLEVGDVIKIKNGMKVYCDIPEMYVTSNKLISRKPIHDVVIVGKKYNNNTDISPVLKSVAESIVENAAFKGFDISFIDTLSFIESKVEKPVEETFLLTEGEYVVTKTKYNNGGSVGRFDDGYGYHVFCTKLVNGDYDENGHKIDFYQSGNFTAMISEIKVIRKMKRTINFV